MIDCAVPSLCTGGAAGGHGGGTTSSPLSSRGRHRPRAGTPSWTAGTRPGVHQPELSDCLSGGALVEGCVLYLGPELSLCKAVGDGEATAFPAALRLMERQHGCALGHGAMMSGLTTSMIPTSCQTNSVHVGHAGEGGEGAHTLCCVLCLGVCPFAGLVITSGRGLRGHCRGRRGLWVHQE